MCQTMHTGFGCHAVPRCGCTGIAPGMMSKKGRLKNLHSRLERLQNEQGEIQEFITELESEGD